MNRKRTTGRVRFILLAAVALAIATAIISAQFGVTWAKRTVQTVLAPIRSGVSALTRKVEQYYDYVFEYEALAAENAHLQKRLTEAENETRDIDALQRENERLAELLNLSEAHIDYIYNAAYIVSWDSSNWKSTFTVGKGSGAGLQVGMVAVTEFGQVVGQISAVGANWATVTTVLDSSLEISASIASSGYTGVVQGSYNAETAGSLRMNYLPSNAVLRNNDQVVTTGSSLYPKNLIIGYIADAGFDETGVSKFAALTPATDFSTLEQVFFITEFSNG